MHAKIHALGEVEIDAEGFEVRKNGAVVAIEPKVLEFLLYLIRHRTRLVSKRELIEQVWRDTFVTESVLTRSACLARKAIGRPELIRTVHGRGYRWVGR